MTIYHDGISIPSASPKDPDSTTWYGFSYSFEDGETISSSLWLIDGESLAVGETSVSGITLEEIAHSDELAQTKAEISGGTVGNRIKLTNRLSTSITDSDDRSMYITIIEL